MKRGITGGSSSPPVQEHSAVQHSAARYSAVQYRTAWYSTVQYGTVQYNCSRGEQCHCCSCLQHLQPNVTWTSPPDTEQCRSHTSFFTSPCTAQTRKRLVLDSHVALSCALPLTTIGDAILAVAVGNPQSESSPVTCGTGQMTLAPCACPDADSSAARPLVLASAGETSTW
jgi:hypothetical protein